MNRKYYAILIILAVLGGCHLVYRGIGAIKTGETIQGSRTMKSMSGGESVFCGLCLFGLAGFLAYRWKKNPYI